VSGSDAPEELMWVAMKAIDAGDRDSLRDLLVAEEFDLERFLPEFVAEQPSLEGRGQFHFDHLEIKSLGGIFDLIRDLGG